MWQYSDSTVNRIVVYEGSMNNVAELTPMRTQILYVIYYKFVLLHLFCSTTMKICFFYSSKKFVRRLLRDLAHFDYLKDKNMKIGCYLHVYGT